MYSERIEKKVELLERRRKANNLTIYALYDHGLYDDPKKMLNDFYYYMNTFMECLK